MTHPPTNIQDMLRQMSLGAAGLEADQTNRSEADIAFLSDIVKTIKATGLAIIADIQHLQYVYSLLGDEVLDASESPSTVLFPVMAMQGTRPRKLMRAAMQEIARLRDMTLMTLVRVWLGILERQDPSSDAGKAQEAIRLVSILFVLRTQRKRNAAAGIVGTNDAATVQMLRGRVQALAQASEWVRDRLQSELSQEEWKAFGW